MRRLARVGRAASPVLLLMIAGCAQGGFADAGGRTSFGDAGPRRDAGERTDAGPRDAGPIVQIDASAHDAGLTIDAGPRCSSPTECDDGSACTTDTCELGECVHTPGASTPGGSCASPIDVSAGGTFSGDSSCAAADFTGACGAGDAPDVHFTFTVPSTASVTLDSIGTSYDAVLALGTSCLGGELGCDDETAGSGQARLTRADLAPGTTYHVMLDGKAGAVGGPWTLNVAIATGPTMETVSFPGSSDTASRGDGLFWNAGDYVRGTRTTSLPNATGATILVVIGENYLDCDTQDMRLLLNGVEAGRFSITSGVSSVSQTFSFASVTGPTYELRYETVRTVSSGCGSAQVLPGGSVTLTR